MSKISRHIEKSNNMNLNTKLGTNPRKPARRRTLALAAAVVATGLIGLYSAQADTLTYNFNDGLQGWTLINPTARDAWNSGGDGWGNTGAGAIYGYDSDDNSTETYWVRSPEFHITDSGPLTVFLWGGGSPLGSLPTNVSDVPSGAIQDGGFMGVGLRDVVSGTYVTSIASSSDGDAHTYGFDVSSYANDGKTYTLDFLDFKKGGWGWVGLDDVSIPGALGAAPAPMFSMAGGHWNDGSNWSTAAIPTISSVVTIDGHAIILDDQRTADFANATSLKIINSGSLDVKSGQMLSIGSSSPTAFDASGGSFTLEGGATLNLKNINSSSLLPSAGVTLASGSTLNVSQTFTVNAAIDLTNVNLGPTTTLNLSNTLTKTDGTAGLNTTNLNVLSGGALNIGANPLTVTGQLMVDGGTFDASSNMGALSTTGATVTVKNGGTLKLGGDFLAASLAVDNGNLDHNNKSLTAPVMSFTNLPASFNMGAGNITASTSLTIDNSTFDASTGAGALNTIGAAVTVQNNGTLKLGGNLSAASVTVNSSNLDTNGHSLNVGSLAVTSATQLLHLVGTVTNDFTLKGGAVTIGASGASIGMATLSGGSLDATNPLTVNVSATLGMVSVYGGGTPFTLSGADVITPTTANHRTITAQGGTMTISPPAPGTDGSLGGNFNTNSSYDPATGIWTVNGTNIGDRPNGAWHYTSIPTSDFDIKVRVTGGHDGWQRVGIRASDGLSTDANWSGVWVVDGGGGACAGYNTAGSGLTYKENLVGSHDWIEITKVGSTVTSYYSTDSGATYTMAYQANFSTWGATTYLGLDEFAGTITGTFDHVTFLGTGALPDWSTTDIAITADTAMALPAGTSTLGVLKLTAGKLSLSGTNAVSIENITGSGTLTNVSTRDIPLTIRNGSGTFSGAITDGTNKISLVKDGSGTLTLSGSASNYSGGTLLKAGTLVVANGAIGSATGSGDVTLDAGTLASAPSAPGTIGGTISGVVKPGNDPTNSGPHSISPGGDGTIGTLSVGGLVINSNTTLRFDITNTSVLDQIIVTGSTLLFDGSGKTTIQVPDNLGQGTYKLIDCGSDTLADSNFELVFFDGTQTPGSYHLLSGTGILELQVGAAATYNWQGLDNGSWNTPGNWNNNIPGVGNTGKVAVLSDTSNAGKTVILDTANVTVAGVTFNNTMIGGNTIAATTGNKLILNGSLPLSDATTGTMVDVTGMGHAITAPMSLASKTEVMVHSASEITISGTIDGKSTLLKTGDGSLFVGGNNANFTGGTTIAAGILHTTNLYALGNPSQSLLSSTAATVNVQSGGTLHVDVPGINLASLTVNGKVTTTSLADGSAGSTGNIELGTVDGSGNTVVAGTLTLGPTGLIDLKDRMLIVHYTQDSVAPSILDGPATAIKAALVQGRNVTPGGVFDGPWTGTAGITSSRAASDFSTAHINTGSPNTEFYALGYGDTGKMTLGDGTITNKMLINDAGSSFFDPTANGGRGAGIGSTVFVRYTRVGDATMDGIVGNNDVTVLGLNFDPTYNPATNPNGPKQWYDGDFNYNGVVDNNDVTILGLQFDPTNTSAVLYSSLVSQYGESFASSFAQGFAQSHPTASLVPEPGALTLLGVGALALIRRRRQA